MIENIIIITILLIGAILSIVYLLWKFLPVITTTPLQAHQCPEGKEWRALLVTKAEQRKVDIGRSVNIATMTPDGQMTVASMPVEYGAVRFFGIECSGCQALLVCQTCGNTPAVGVIIENRIQQIGLLVCCRDHVMRERA